MKRYLLDTNICIFYLKGKYDLLTRIEKVGRQHCFISEITVAELLYGASCSNDKKRVMSEVSRFINVKHLTRVPQIKIENWINR